MRKENCENNDYVAVGTHCYKCHKVWLLFVKMSLQQLHGVWSRIKQEIYE